MRYRCVQARGSRPLNEMCDPLYRFFLVGGLRPLFLWRFKFACVLRPPVVRSYRCVPGCPVPRKPSRGGSGLR